MTIPGSGLLHIARRGAEDAEQSVNQVPIPLTRRLGLVDFAKALFKTMGEDHVGAFAGNLAYQALFAIFPFLVFLVSLLGIFHATSLVNTLVDHARTAMPPAAVTLLKRDILGSITRSHSEGAFTIGAIVAILAALWGVSGGFRAVMEAMNVMYNVKDSRPTWKQYLISFFLSIGVTVLLIVALVLIVFGSAIGGTLANQLGLGAAFQWTWNILQWPVLLCFVLLAFALIYYFAPDVRQRFRFISPGAVTALVAWVAFSLLFTLYVSNFGSYNKTYGTLAGLAIFMLYTYYSAFILLIGAEINQIVEAHAAGGKKEGERVPGERSRTGKTRDHASSLETVHQNGADHHDTLQILRENRPKSRS